MRVDDRGEIIEYSNSESLNDSSQKIKYLTLSQNILSVHYMRTDKNRLKSPLTCN